MKIKVQHLNILLLKTTVTTGKDALKEPRKVDRHLLQKFESFRGVIFVPSAVTSKPPGWLDFLNQGVSQPLTLANTFSSAVMIVETSNRLFAISFGYGRNLLRPEVIERDFGFKVALNTVKPDEIRSVDVQNFEDLTVHTRRQASTGSPLATFGLDATRDVMRSVTGKPMDPALGRQITGSDALSLNAQLAFTDIGSKCDRLLLEYHKTDYQKSFPFVDKLRRVRDDTKIDELNSLLVQDLRSGASTNAYLAVPRPLDWEQFAAFNYSTEAHGDEHQDLDLDHYLSTVSRTALSLGNLRQDRIGIKHAGMDATREKWSIYDALVYERSHNGDLYALSAGDWYVIESDYAKKVENDVLQIRSSTLPLPAALANEDERTYNMRAAATAPNIFLLDRGNKKVGGARTPIECCDLFTASGELVHVKRKTRSSTLSHLFSQGVASAESLLWDDAYRSRVRGLLVNSAAHIRQLGASKLDPSAFEVVYAVITKRTPNWPASLPFLSQLNLANAARALGRMNYRVSLLRIDCP